MKKLVVIPARYSSSRFEGKVLAKETGKFLIQHVYERALCAKTVDGVLIATDSEMVRQACKEFGAECIMTSAEHQSGTDRIAEAVRERDVDIVVNLQGDEPEIEPEYIDIVARLLVEDETAPMATLVTEFENAEQVADANVVKVVVDENDSAVYFSRSVIPYDRQAEGVGEANEYLRHLGIYAYRKDFLLEFAELGQGNLESIEKLEQLRAVEHGYTILTAKVEHAWEGIDTKEQYDAFVNRFRKEDEK